MSKLALIFPGIGYHCDKPLLYYSKKLAAQAGYEIHEVNYGGFPSDVRGNPEKMKQCFMMALEQSNDALSGIDFGSYEDILIIGKSVGTAVAGAFAHNHGLKCRFILYTPVEQTFLSNFDDAIVFHGNKDPWAETKLITEKCSGQGMKLYITDGANHSLETEDVIINIRNMETIMNYTREYISLMQQGGLKNLLS